MKIDEFISGTLLQQKEWRESEQLEWKESTSDMKLIVNTVAAFANTRGGGGGLWS